MSRIIVPAAATNKKGEKKSKSVDRLDYDSIRSLSAVGVFSCRC